jgi:DNA-binding MarR family transcriptional regulator
MEEKLDKVIYLLQYLVALELQRSGVTQSTIGTHLHVAKATVVEMLRGVDKKGRAVGRSE